MKKTFLFLVLTSLFVLANLSSCSTSKPIVIQEQSIVVDYESFTGSGFRITPFEYSSAEFEVIGTIYKEFSHRRTIEYMINDAISSAKNIGANGLMKFDIKYHYDDINLTSYVVTGVAVKFKD